MSANAALAALTAINLVAIGIAVYEHMRRVRVEARAIEAENALNLWRAAAGASHPRKDRP